MRRKLLALSCVTLAGAVMAQNQPPYTAAKTLDFRTGNAKAGAMLARIPELRDVVSERFGVAMVDLDDDGRDEIVVHSQSSGFCGSGGCATVVVQQQGNRMVTLLSQHLTEPIGVTQQKVGRYHALAMLDEKGRVAVADRRGTPMHGKQMVYPLAAPRPGTR